MGGHLPRRLLGGGPLADDAHLLHQLGVREEVAFDHLPALHEQSGETAMVARVDAERDQVVGVREEGVDPALLLAEVRRLERRLARRVVSEVLTKVRDGE